MSDEEERPMSAYPLPPLPASSPALPHPLTVGDYAALDEFEHGRIELMEGNLVMSPRPLRRHNQAGLRLAMQLVSQVPAQLEVDYDLDVDLLLAAPDEPGTVRCPDLIVIEHTAGQRVDEEGGMFLASDLVLAVEIVSPGSRRMDHVMKRSEYQDAGIPFYWIIDLDEPVSLLACRLDPEIGYLESAKASGTFTAEEPFAVTVRLDELV